MIGEATYIACRNKQQLLPSTKQELPAWIYVRGKVQFKSMCCLEGIECGCKVIYEEGLPNNEEMRKFFPILYIRRPLVIYDFAPDPENFLFYQCTV